MAEGNAELTSLRCELAKLLGPRSPRAGTTANDQWISAVAEVLDRAERAESIAAECYRLTGSDPDGDPDSMLIQHAVQAVRELREENERVGEWEDRAIKAEAALAKARTEGREEALEAVEALPRLMRTKTGMCRTGAGAFIRRKEALDSLTKEES